MRPHRWLLTLASRLVPKDTRAEWRAEWDAELHHRESAMQPWAGRRGTLELLRRSSGAFWDALWLQSSRWYSLRLFGRHWRLALTAVLSLAVAIAATGMGLSAYNALLFRPPAVGNPGSLRSIHIRTAAEPFGAASFPEYDAYRAQTRAFSDIAAFPYSISSNGLTLGDFEAQVTSAQVSDNFFAVLGITPEAGLLSFRSSPAGDTVDIVIGHSLWRKLGGTMDVLGKTVRINDQALTIVGVAPPTFRGMMWGFDPDVWMSLKTAEKVLGNPPALMTDRTQQWLNMVGRLKPGVNQAQAATDSQLVASAIARDRPDTNASRSAVLTELTVTPPGERGWTAMILSAMFLVVLLTLIVACANVTNLLLGLSTSRRHEMLVRAALGASRLQLVLPLLRESAMLGLVAGALGYGAAWVALSRLASFSIPLGAYFPSMSMDLRPDGLVMAATIAVALVAGVAVGLTPALRGAADGLSGAINRELVSVEPRRTRIRRILVVIQMAIAAVVLVGVGTSLRSLASLQHPALGFSAKRLVLAGVDVRRSGYDAKTSPAFYGRIREHLLAMPGIEAVSLASQAPLFGYSSEGAREEHDPPPPDGHSPQTPSAVVDEHYFSTIGMSVVAGRTFDSRDQLGRAETVVINATLARRHWPGQNPIGRHLRLETGNRLVEVIGVVPDAKYGDVDEDQLPFMYFALAQHDQPAITVIARSSGERDTVMRALGDMDSSIVFGGVGMMTLDDMLGVQLLLPRVIVWTTMAFGLVALALAVFGLYSTVFYAVSQRRIEMGIRTTLGATPGHLFALVMKESGSVALLGALVGLGLGLALTPLASSIFYGIHAVEPLVLAGTAILSTAIALLTTYLVVRPWTRLAPVELMRR